MSFSMRRAVAEDAAPLLEIYAPYVGSTDNSISDVSFEYILPSREEFSERIEKISVEYPYLVCLLNDRPVGYGYAHRYIERAAYQWDAELTVYLSSEARGKGFGKAVYRALEDILKLQGVVNLYACITGSNEHSIAMHKSMGFRQAGFFKNAGFKNGHWLDVVWMAKTIAHCDGEPAAFKSVNEIGAKALADILRRISAELA